MSKVKLLKKLDGIAGQVLCRILPSSASLMPVSFDRILIIRPGGIGDAVLLIPSILALKKAWPQVRIDVLAEKRNASAFDLYPGVDTIFLYDHPRDLLDVLKRTYDVVVDTEQWHRLSAVVTRLIRSQVRIGYGTNERRRMFSHVVSYCHDDYEAQSFLNLLRPLGIDAQVPDGPFLKVPEADQRYARALLEPAGEQSVVVLFPGASVAERQWGAERFRQVAKKLNTDGYFVVVVGGGEDQESGEQICADDVGLNLAGKTNLVQTAAVLERAHVLISGDSGVLHLGIGLGVPTVSLFGAGIARKWAPQGGKHQVLNRQLPCSPCTRFGYTPPCPRGVECLAGISVEDVLAAASRIDKQQTRKR